MDVIYADEKRMELGILQNIKKLDVECGTDNDFELSLTKNESDKQGIKQGFYIIVPDSEFGGIIEEYQKATDDDYIYWRGYTWRGFLNQIVTKPAEVGTSITDEDANDVISRVLSIYGLGEMFELPTVPSGVVIKNLTVDRYITPLELFDKMLSAYGGKLKISVKQGRPNAAFTIKVEAVKAADHSEDEYTNEQSGITLDIQISERGINHLVCLGKGELDDRMIVDLYVQEDGSISETPFYTGTAERMGRYENTSSETRESLVSDGIKKLKTLQNYKKATLHVENKDLDIGDIVGARDYSTNVAIKKPIISKILNYNGTTSKIEYEVEGDD